MQTEITIKEHSDEINKTINYNVPKKNFHKLFTDCIRKSHLKKKSKFIRKLLSINIVSNG